jgi:hypothetical protein
MLVRSKLDHHFFALFLDGGCAGLGFSFRMRLLGVAIACSKPQA